MIQEAERIGVDGIVIGNTNECGRPTKELLESATNARVPVAFVASEVVSEIETMQEQVALEPHSEDVRHDAFIYLSIYNGQPDHESHVVNHILASTHILLATMVVLALLIYLSLACSVGSLRYIPREIAPDIFGTRAEPLDKGTLEQLPLIPVKWNVNGLGDDDEEARCESPSTIDLGQTRKALLQQLAGIIVRSGDGSYLFTEEKECAICLDSYVFNDSLRLLPCKHAFHRKCIDAWLLSESMTVHCPVCKSSITDGLRLLDKHGYSDVLNLLRGDSCVAGHCCLSVSRASLKPLRYSTTSKPDTSYFGSNPYLQQLSRQYKQAHDLCMNDPERFSSSHMQHMVSTSRDIFPNTELRLSKVRTFGFDYDYTLARYTDKLPETIYTMIRDVLVKRMLYPPALQALKYDKTFAIRGLSYDRETGWLFKLDSNYNIAMDTVHYGREPLRDLEEVYSLHNGTHVAPDYVKNQLYQLNDIYSVPEATLLADIIQYFTEQNIPFHPRYLAEDIRAAGEYIHKGDGISLSPLHSTIINNIGDYLDRAPELLQILNTLKSSGKRLFLLTNSGYQYINAGLTYMFGTRDWRALFDVVIVGARKPSWYLSHRPFRLVPTDTQESRHQPWAHVDHFEDGQVYSGGNLMTFTNITGYSDRNVMYFGDHIYSDLRDPSIQKGWFTGAIVSELKYELSVIQRSEYRQLVTYIQLIEKILKTAQQQTRSAQFTQLSVEEKEAFRQLLEVGRVERRQARWKLRDCFNTNFGSVFRTEKYPSLFATKIKAFANVYTADLSNLGEYPLDFIFYPKRMTQAHESRMPEVDDLLEEIY
ncbi:hypothetical protein LPJ55_002684 [Coemansia sp. RSA 990]|nr:hypothetical protein LPJ68_002043 [Coemansia sp. RSA 1086]KAJ1872970.1 hypothetical protein LPJ55_002684 [Coemansia sp. RSA 990]